MFSFFGVSPSAVGKFAPILPGSWAVISAVGKKKKCLECLCQKQASSSGEVQQHAGSGAPLGAQDSGSQPFRRHTPAGGQIPLVLALHQSVSLPHRLRRPLAPVTDVDKAGVLLSPARRATPRLSGGPDASEGTDWTFHDAAKGKTCWTT